MYGSGTENVLETFPFQWISGIKQPVYATEYMPWLAMKSWGIKISRFSAVRAWVGSWTEFQTAEVFNHVAHSYNVCVSLSHSSF